MIYWITIVESFSRKPNNYNKHTEFHNETKWSANGENKNSLLNKKLPFAEYKLPQFKNFLNKRGCRPWQPLSNLK